MNRQEAEPRLNVMFTTEVAELECKLADGFRAEYELANHMVQVVPNPFYITIQKVELGWRRRVVKSRQFLWDKVSMAALYDLMQNITAYENWWFVK